MAIMATGRRTSRPAPRIVSDPARILERAVPPAACEALRAGGVHPVLARIYASRGLRAVSQLDTSLARLLPWPRN